MNDTTRPLGRDDRERGLDFAIKMAERHCPPERIIAEADRFADYLRHGAPPPAPAANPLPRGLMDVGRRAPAMRLDIVIAVLLERERQESKGWTADHDDGHSDGEIANEAAFAIMTPDAADFTYPATGWVDAAAPRRKQLVQGIALAFAELERLDRAADRAFAHAQPDAIDQDFRTHGQDSAVDDDQVQRVTLDAPVLELVDTLTRDDLDNMHHAIGRPADVWKATHRNYFATGTDTPDAHRFRELRPFWIEADAASIAKGMRYFSLTAVGRAALGHALERNPEWFRIEIK